MSGVCGDTVVELTKNCWLPVQLIACILCRNGLESFANEQNATGEIDSELCPNVACDMS